MSTRGQAVRRTFLWRSSPFVAIVGLIAAYLALLSFVAAVGVAVFASGAPAGSASSFRFLERISLVERWKAPYNLGTVQYVEGDNFAASEALSRALELVPKGEEQRTPDECKVAINLSLAYEGLGDEALRFADDVGALEFYQLALATSEGCDSESQSDESDSQEEQEQQESADESQQRQQDKADELEEAGEPDGADGDGQPADPGDGSDGSGDGQQGQGDGTDQGDGSGSDNGEPGEGQPGDQEPEPGQEQLDELQERNEQAQDNAEDERQGSGSGGGTGQNW